ncbi:MAG: hypothetical protein HGA45_08820 [Chloroflexales bacterium]|nr:hypothetical protein [Chloroflexales bacterium]
MGLRHALCWLLIVAMFCGAIAPLPQAIAAVATRKVSAPLSIGRSVTDYLVSPDGRWVVYRADQETDNSYELFAVALSGGTPHRLNQSLAPGTSVESDFQINPDSQRVVYRAQAAGAAAVELYSVLIAGGTPQRLNGLLVARGKVSDFQISPSGLQVVYRAAQDDPDILEVFRAPIKGGDAVRLSHPLPLGANVFGFRISLDSRWLVYQVGGDVFSVPLAESYLSRIQLNPAGTAASSAVNFALSGDSRYVIMPIDNDSNLYSVPIAGPNTAAKKLTSNQGSLRNAQYWTQLSPDGARVVILINQGLGGRRLYSAPTGGSEADVGLLSPAAEPDEPKEDFAISPDGLWVLFRADFTDTSSGTELWKVPINGGSAPVRLSSPLFGGRNVVDFQISPDGQRAVYRVDQTSLDTFELYSVALAGGAPLRLSGPPPGLGRSVVPGYSLTPDSDYVVFQGDLDTAGVLDLYSAPLASPSAPTPARLTGAPGSGGTLQRFSFTPGGTGVFYLADQDLATVSELYLTDVAQPQVTFAGDLSASESDGQVALGVRLSRIALTSVSVPYQVSGGSAEPGRDFNLASGIVTFPPGVIEQSIPIALSDNTAVGPEAKTIEVSLGTPTNAVLGSPGLATVTISDDDAPDARPDWLVLLYLAGDDASPANSRQVSLTEAIRDLRDRLNLMPYNPAMRLVVLYDGNQPNDSAVYVREQAGLTEVTEQAAASPLWSGGIPGSPGQHELNTGTPITLRNFVNWVRNTYPGARYTFLSIVDHGGGWAPDFTRPPIQPRGMGGIQPAEGWRGMSLDLSSGGATLSTLNTGAALSGLGTFDLLFFDACLMGMIESAYEVRNAADYFVAGQNLMFADLPYEDYLAAGALSAETKPLDLARRIVERYNARMNPRKNPYAIAAVDLTRLRGGVRESLATRINTLADILLADLPLQLSSDDPLAKALITSYQGAQKFDYDNSLSLEPSEGYVDLVDFMSRLQHATDPAISQRIKDAAAAVVAAAQAGPPPVIVASRAESGAYEGKPWNLDGATGLSIYLPLGEQDYRPTRTDPNDPSKPAQPEPQLAYYSDPNQLAFTRDVPQWAALLRRLEGAVPSVRASEGRGAVSADAFTTSVDARPFYAPYPVQAIKAAYLPLVVR